MYIVLLSNIVAEIPKSVNSQNTNFKGLLLTPLGRCATI